MEELDSVLEFVLGVSETSPGWSVCTDKKDLFALKSIDIDTGIFRGKTTGALPGIPAEVVFMCLYDAESRTSWDSDLLFSQSQPSPTACFPAESTTDVILTCAKSPFGVANREFLEWRLWRKVKDDYQIYTRSCDWEDAPNVVHGRVRADVIASVFVIRSLPGGNSEVIFMSQVDLKGYIPKTIINTLAPSAPLHWIRKVRSACQDFMRRNELGASSERAHLDRLVNETLMKSNY
jgi:hypothetical protein